MGFKKIFLGWEEGLSELASQRLMKEAQVSEFIDLSHVIAIVSTSHSMKVLNSKLTELADKQGFALLPPRIETPQFFFSNHANKKVPAETQRLLFWIEAIKQNVSHCNFLFPDNAGKDESFLWFLDKAVQISKLADSLAAIGLTIEQLIEVYPKLLGEDFTRFDELSHIEASYFKCLKDNGYEDENAVKVEAARNPQIPANISKVIFIAVPDPTPVVLESIEMLSAATDVEIWINAPQELECAFDSYGRPLQAEWQNMKIEIPDFKNRVTLFESPENLARDFVNLIANKNSSGNSQVSLDDLSIIMPDASLEIPIHYSFQKQGIITYNPSGRKLSDYQLYALFKAVSAFISEQDYATFASIFRNADFLSFAEKKTEVLDYAKLFIFNDEIQNQFMPLTFADLVKLASSAKTDDEITVKSYFKVLDLLKDFLEKSGGNCLKAFDITVEIYKTISTVADKEVIEALKAISDCIAEIEISTKNSELTQRDIALILNKKLQGITLFPAQEEGMLPLRGYLELQWEEADRPFSYIVGMNEGVVPSVTTSDIFLPDSVRKKIGLPCNDSRFARDAFILQSVISSKRNSAINFVVMKTNKEGESLKPSRLLMQTNNQDDFYARLVHLYRGNSVEFERIKEDSTDFPVKYSIPLKSLEKNTLSVTDFKSYLTCPFRFYLGKVLAYKEEADDRQTDIDEATFGSICHSILKELGDNLNSKNQKMLETLLESKLKQEKSRFSKSIPVEFSFYSLEQRMRKALELMLEDRQKGIWKVYATEMPFKLTLDSQRLGEWLDQTVNKEFSFLLKGRIDRIDIGADGTSLRVIDYKTGKVSESPAKEHYRGVSANSDLSRFKPYSLFDFEGKKYRWEDLQLPLYAIILSETEEFKNLKIAESSYFTIPKAVSDTDIKSWIISEKELAAAKRCVAEIILDIAEGNFWPPSEKIEYDNYEKFLYSPDYENYITYI